MTTIRVPEAPIGWPSAIAPPNGFTFSVGIFKSLMTAILCAAKASFSSKISTFSSGIRVRATNFSMAGTGPIPMIAGSTPASAYPFRVARIGRFNSLAYSRVVIMTQAAPSLIPEEFPAVITPSFLKAGFNPERLSSVVLARMNSSLALKSSDFVLRLKTATGVISFARCPSSCALAAFC